MPQHSCLFIHSFIHQKRSFTNSQLSKVHLLASTWPVQNETWYSDRKWDEGFVYQISTNSFDSFARSDHLMFFCRLHKASSIRWFVHWLKRFLKLDWNETWHSERKWHKGSVYQISSTFYCYSFYQNDHLIFQSRAQGSVRWSVHRFNRFLKLDWNETWHSDKTWYEGFVYQVWTFFHGLFLHNYLFWLPDKKFVSQTKNLASRRKILHEVFYERRC